MHLTNAQAATELRDNTERFLRNYSLMLVPEPPSSQSLTCGILDMNMGGTRRAGHVLGNLRKHATQNFQAGPLAAINNQHGPGAATIMAHWIKMDAWNSPADIQRIQPYVLPLGGASLLFTVMLSGCSIGIQALPNGGLEVVHVQPNLIVDGAALQQTLGRSGWTKVYGKQNYGNRSCTIVGTRSGTRWKLWAQHLNTGDNYAVAKVERVYP